MPLKLSSLFPSQWSLWSLEHLIISPHRLHHLWVVPGAGLMSKLCSFKFKRASLRAQLIPSPYVWFCEFRFLCIRFPLELKVWREARWRGSSSFRFKLQHPRSLPLIPRFPLVTKNVCQFQETFLIFSSAIACLQPVAKVYTPLNFSDGFPSFRSTR